MNKFALSGILLIGIIGLPVGLYFITELTAAKPTERETPPTPVVVTPASRQPFVDRIEAIGTARANESVAITPPVTERITAVFFEDGDLVEEGDLIVELSKDEELALEDEELATLAEEKASLLEAEASLVAERARVTEVKASIREAEKDLNRIKRLLDEGVSTESDLEEATASFETLQAQLETAEARIASAEARVQSAEARVQSANARAKSQQAKQQDRILRAPFAGMLGLRQVSAGATVSPSTVITTLDDIDPIKLDFSIPEKFISSIKMDQEIEAHSVAYPGQTFSGKISGIDSRLDPVSRSVVIRALIDNPDATLRPGMLLTVEVIQSRDNVLLIPEQAVVPRQGQNFVYTIDEESNAQLTPITTGRRQPGVVEIIDGIEESTQVVSEGTIRLRPGAPVEIVEVREDFILPSPLSYEGE